MCRCKIQDWAKLRESLGLTQGELGTLLGVDRGTIARWESHRHHRCPLPRVERDIRELLKDPDLQRLLRRAGYPLPWPEDAESPSVR